MYRRISTTAAIVALGIGLAVPVSAESTIEATPRLEATNDITITWSDSDRAPAGHVVEFTNRPTDEWVILGFLPAEKREFRHPRLAPGTPYRYRVRAFYGPTSHPVTVTIAEGLSDRAYADAYALPEDYSWAPPRRDPGATASARPTASLRAPESAAAAPADLKAEVIRKTVSGFRLTWRDQSNDEEGFLLERVASPTDFVVCAVVPPDMNSFGWALEPPQRHATFRLRAFYFGAPSPVISVVTHPDNGRDAAPARPGRGT